MTIEPVASPNGKQKAPHPYEIAKEITQLHNVFATPINSKGVGEELFFYQNGVYLGGVQGELKIRQEAGRLMEGRFKADQVDEVMKLVRELARKEYKWINRHGKELINTKRNMLGWENGTILDHDPSYNSIFQVNARYLPGINCDIVDSFLMDVFPPDCLELAEELIGYCLIPSNAFQVAFILLGGGANGKSTFLRVLMELVGKNSVSNVSLQQLSENNFAAANLFGKLLNIHPDIPSRNLADSSLFKSITGGDRIMAERKYGHPFEFEPFAKLLFSCNELPRSYDKSMAFFRRLVIIPFPNQFLAGKADPDIFDKLITAEAMSAWLNHGIVGLKRLFEKKAFTIPETVKLAAADYQLQCDSALSFIKEYLEPLDGANLQKTFLYKKYCEWSSANNIRRPEFPRYFNIAMTLEGYRESVETHVNGANKIWRNVRLNEDLEGF